MQKIKTESDKLRDKIYLSDAELEIYCLENGIPYSIDGAGKPWLSYAALISVIEGLYFEKSLKK